MLNTTLTTSSANVAQNTIDLSNHDFPDTGFLVNMTLRHDGNYLDLTATSVGYNVVGKTLYLYAFNKNNDWAIGLSSSVSVVIFTVKNG